MVKKNVHKHFQYTFLFLEKESQSHTFQHFFRKRKEEFAIGRKANQRASAKKGIKAVPKRVK